VDVWPICRGRSERYVTLVNFLGKEIDAQAVSVFPDQVVCGTIR